MTIGHYLQVLGSMAESGANLKSTFFAYSILECNDRPPNRRSTMVLMTYGKRRYVSKPAGHLSSGTRTRLLTLLDFRFRIQLQNKDCGPLAESSFYLLYLLPLLFSQNMIQLLPVIPEDEAVCSYMDDWPREIGFSDGRVDDSHDKIAYDSSRFGYVAILRDDTVLLEVGRPFASLQLNSLSVYDHVESKEDVNHWNVLDATIYGLLQPAAVPGWQAFCLNASTESPQTDWKGLRFHVYDDTVGRLKNDFTIWTFCLVYRCMQNEYANHYQEWMVDNLIQFTELFRKNDVVWQTGSTLSCQFLFAPVVEQRMNMNHGTYSTRQQRTPALAADQIWSDVDCWSLVAEQIIDRNHSILEAAEEGSFLDWGCALTKAATPPASASGPPFVSDESDCDDSDSNSSLGNRSLENGEQECVASDYDDESSKASDQNASPERVGGFPRYYCSEDDENACLERLAASNSVWNSLEQSKKCDDFPLMANRIVVFSITAKTDKSLLSVPTVSVPLATENSNPEDSSNGSVDSDGESIPLICLVGNQVDDQHSDLWKRSPKCISKAVALGLSPHRQKPIQLPNPSLSPLTKQCPSVNETETFPSPLEVMASAIAETFEKFWKLVSSKPDDQQNVKTAGNNAAASTYQDDGCWCRPLFRPKPSALL
jgi:hypothetical protein